MVDERAGMQSQAPARAQEGPKALGRWRRLTAGLRCARVVDEVTELDGQVHLAGRYVIAAEILGGRRVGVRIEESTLMFFDPATRELLRTRPSPLTWDQACTIRGASPAGPPPRPSAEPITVQRRASNTGVIVVAGQKIALGRIHARQVVTVHVAADTITIDLGGDDVRTIRRTTTQAAASRPSSSATLGPPMFPRAPVKHVLGQIQPSGGTRQRSLGRSLGRDRWVVSSDE